jgi:DNA-binding NarL/FixJ family response regulator
MEVKDVKKKVTEIIKDACAQFGDKIDQGNLNIYYRIICTVYVDISVKLENLYPQLYKEKWAFEVALLTCAGFDNYEIAWFLRLGKNTVEHKQSHIRKNCGIKQRENIKLFLLNKIEEK